MILSISGITIGASVIVTMLAPKMDDVSDGIDLPAPLKKKNNMFLKRKLLKKRVSIQTITNSITFFPLKSSLFLLHCFSRNFERIKP